MLTFIYPSQLEKTYGGKAPDVTRFWPPTMPPVTEHIDEKALNLVPRNQYLAHIKKHPNLPRMHKSMMSELLEDGPPEESKTDRTSKINKTPLVIEETKT